MRSLLDQGQRQLPHFARQITVTRRVLIIAILLLCALPVRAANCVFGPTVTVCASGCDHVTLSQAIASGAGRLVLSAEPYDAVELVIDRYVRIEGVGADATVLQAGPSPEEAAGRLFQVTAQGYLALSNLTLRHGNPRDTAREGGLIYSEGEVTASGCVLAKGRANDGGAIVSRGPLSLYDCWLTDNVADGKAPFKDRCGSGGAIKARIGSEVRLDHCTISGNTAEKKGGGIHVSCGVATRLTNCTIHGNRARQDGGGLSVRGEAWLTHCTLSANRSPTRGGGGVFSRGVTHLDHCLLAGNEPGGDAVFASRGGHYGYGEITVEGPNLVADGSLPTAMGGNARLGEFASLGGVVPVVPLLPGSAAIDAGLGPREDLAADQCGQPRAAAYLGDEVLRDLGAVEMQVENAGGLARVWRRVQHWWGSLRDG